MANKPERVFISIDMEGISSIVDWTHVDRDHAEYGYYRKMMAGDLNAAIEGALAAGAKEIVVSDAHGGMRNLQPEDVNEAAYLIRGSPKPDSMMEGIDDGHYDAVLFVGYHSMVGTENGILAHTIAGSTVDGVIINGRETGEFGMNAALAGWHGVPSVFLAGDAAACLLGERARRGKDEVGDPHDGGRGQRPPLHGAHRRQDDELHLRRLPERPARAPGIHHHGGHRREAVTLLLSVVLSPF
ncbi:MAG: M55 family metallopeptidase [Candidatus Bathyarchaeota archaeon]|nr:M55 family metallopeptidase [Candidatus Bathyarchaeota archaeon]